MQKRKETETKGKGGKKEDGKKEREYEKKKGKKKWKRRKVLIGIVSSASLKATSRSVAVIFSSNWLFVCSFIPPELVTDERFFSSVTSS